MPSQNIKANLLDDAGYAYNYERMMYINRQARKAFSIRFIDDKSESEIASRIQEPHAAEDWLFYTSSDLSEGIKRELRRVLQ